jgi:hypothetical protein
MSSSIWTQCAADSEIGLLRREPWRAVESQHQISTRKLVDSDAEQQVLEELIEGVKPPDPTHGRLHYLLFTPFRYPPLPHGSRFGARMDRGIWYGAETIRGAFAEVAYYRLLFLEGTRADLGPIEAPLTTFRVKVRTRRGLDLTRPPFDAYASVLASPTDYTETQAVGSAMRKAGVQAFCYPSARDIQGGTNVGVLDPAAFGRSVPSNFAMWYCSASTSSVEMRRLNYFDRDVYTFSRSEFEIDGALPRPAL